MLLAMTVGETFATGGITAGLGIGVTFLVLVVLIFIVSLVTKIEKVDFKKLFSKLQKKKEETTTGNDAEQSPKSDNLSENQKLAAAITAAITVVLSAECADNAPKAAFKVKSIKRI